MYPAPGGAPDQNADPGLLARIQNAADALTQRDPIRPVPDYYADPAQMPRETFGAQALKNIASAYSKLMPDDSIQLPGGVRMAPPIVTGAVGKYELANKFGDGLIEASREFQPLVNERRLLKKANAAALANGVPPGLGPRPAQELLQMIPSDIDLSSFSKPELQELADRAWQDKGTVYQDPRYQLTHTPFSDLESRIRQRSDQLAELDALNKKPGVRKLYDPGIARDLYWEGRANEFRDVDMDSIIKRLQSENNSLPGAPKPKK